jgi:DNA-binding CsgD family transcriptional regulator
MSGLVLTSEDRDACLAALKATKKPALEHRRMNVLLLLDDGIATAIIARMLYLDERTVDEYRRLYETQGASGIHRLGYKGRPGGLMRDEDIAVLKAHMAEQMYMTS